MAKRKRGNPELFKAIIDEYNITSTDDLQQALKDLLGGAMETLLNAEMDNHLGYEKHEKANEATLNRRNGTTTKKVQSKNGEFEIDVPRDRDGTFEPQIISKRKKDISSIEAKIIKMYGKGMSQRDISATISDIYGFDICKDQIKNITDKILPEIDTWHNRALKPCYVFLFIDCMYVSIRRDGTVRNCAVYTILGYDIEGNKEIIGIWVANTESKSEWMNIFDEIKKRGVEDILFISMDGVSGLEPGAKSIFPEATIQRCIVHLIRNSMKFIPSKDMKEFGSDLKKIYAATSLKVAEKELENLNSKYKDYTGALRIWNDHSSHVFQLFTYGNDVRRIMYTTNAIEAVHSSYRKVTKKGTFSSENSLLKVLYLRVNELKEKWDKGSVHNWSLVLNQLLNDEKLSKIISKYTRY